MQSKSYKSISPQVVRGIDIIYESGKVMVASLQMQHSYIMIECRDNCYLLNLKLKPRHLQLVYHESV